jgi:RNA 3'-terminal phosphate cyclase-like protein
MLHLLAGHQHQHVPHQAIASTPLSLSSCLLVCPLQGSKDAAGSAAAGDEPLVVPEDIGRAAAQLLLDEVARGGVTDGTHQGLLLLLAALGPEEMNQVGMGSMESLT